MRREKNPTRIHWRKANLTFSLIMECAPYVTKKNWEMGRRGDWGNTTAIATALTHDEKKNSVMWEPIFWRGFFRLPPFYMFIYCSVFVPFPIMIWNENREENQCQCFYSSAFHCCAYPIYCDAYTLLCSFSISVCVSLVLFFYPLYPHLFIYLSEKFRERLIFNQSLD